MKYKFLDHTADIKFRACGKDLNEAFENVVLAFSEFITKGNKIKLKKKQKIKVEGTDLENLLYNFIDELIYLLDAKMLIVAKGKVRIKGNKLVGELIGDNVKNYKGLDHVKAATYAEMYVKKKKNAWEIQAVVDV